MRKVVIIFAGIFSLLAVMLVVFMIYIINHNGNETGSPIELKLVNTQQIKLGDINNIEIKYYADDIEFYKSESSDLILKEYKTYTPTQEELAIIISKNGQLSIEGEQGNKKGFSWSNHYGKAEVYLPSDYVKNLNVSTSSGKIKSDLSFKFDDFQAVSASGEIRFNEVIGQKLQFSTASGNITLEKTEGNRKVITTSGSIKLNSGDGDSFVQSSSGAIYIKGSNGAISAKSISGNIKIADNSGTKDLGTSSGTIIVDHSSGDIYAKSVSGAIKIDSLEGNCKLESVSGVLTLDIQKLKDTITMNSTSGDIKLKVPGTSAFGIKADGVSGRVRTNFDDLITIDQNKNHASGSVGENIETSIQLNSVSGNISVQR